MLMSHVSLSLPLSVLPPCFPSLCTPVSHQLITPSFCVSLTHSCCVSCFWVLILHVVSVFLFFVLLFALESSPVLLSAFCLPLVVTILDLDFGRSAFISVCILLLIRLPACLHLGLLLISVLHIQRCLS